MRISLAWFILFSALLISCGNRDQGNTSGEIMSGVRGGEIVLKAAGGYTKVNINDIKSLTITVKDLPSSTAPSLTKTFTGNKIPAILSVMGLEKPSEPGFPSALETGEVILSFESENLQSRTIKILNNDILEDWLFKEVIYRTSHKFDRAWLEKQ